MEFEEGLEKKEECGFAANLLDKQGMRASSKTSFGSHFLLRKGRTFYQVFLTLQNLSS